MRIDSADSKNTNTNANANTNTSAVNTAISLKSSTVVSDNDKVKMSQLSKPISQINEYDKNNMPVSEKVVIEAIQKANKAIQGGNRRFEFSIHEGTNQILIKVYNSDTNELIKEIPNEKILDMVAKICEMAGILVDERR
jgi:flagellar protein FlaG